MKRRILRIVGFVMAGIVVILLATLIYLKLAGPSFIKDRMIERVADRTNGRYALAIDTLDFTFFPITLHLGGVEFKRNYDIKEYSGNPLFDKFNLNLKFRSLYVNRFKVHRFLFGNTLKVDEFKWVEPRLIIRKNRYYDPDKAIQLQIDTTAIAVRDSVQSDTLLA